jgi:hypothetical protein
MLNRHPPGSRKAVANNTRLGLLLLGALALGDAGCAGSTPHSTHHHEVSGEVTLFADQYRVRGYDENDPRLVRVREELEQIYGRAIAIRFHVDTMPRESGFFEHLLNQELGKLPGVMQRWKKSHPDVFDRMMAELRHIDFDYDGSQTEATSEYGKQPGRLRIVLSDWQLEDKLVNSVMFNAHRRWLTQHYLSRPPEAIAAAERYPYLKALRSAGATHFSTRSPLPDDQREPDPGRSDVILLTLRLAEVASSADAKLSRDLEKHLLEDGGYLHECYSLHPKFVDRVKAPSPFPEAERAWTKWALGGLQRFDYETRADLLDLLIVRGRSEPRLIPDPRAFPGFDVKPLGFSLLTEWANAGHLTTAGSGRDEVSQQARYFDRLVCATAASNRGFRTSRARNCRPNFYAAALTDAPSREQLLERAATTSDAILRRELTLNLLELTTSHWGSRELNAIGSVLDLWRRLERSPKRFKEMASLLAVEIDHSTELREALYDATTRHYHTRPSDRGELLFLLSRIDGYGRTEVNWKRFEEIYGARISAANFATYLEQGTLAFEELHQLWPALGQGWSVADVIVKYLPSYLDAPMAEQYEGTRTTIVRRIGRNVAEHDSLQGLKKLRELLEAHVLDNPQRERRLRYALDSIRDDVEQLERKSAQP